MPIRFRCVYCDKLLGIARRKAGAVVNCPHCGEKLIVPTPEEGPNTEGAEPEQVPKKKETQEEAVFTPAHNGGQLFERSDFEALLQPEPTFRNNEDDEPPPAPAKPKKKEKSNRPPPLPRAPDPLDFDAGDVLPPLAPIPLDEAPQRDHPPEGIFVSRSRATWISVIAVLVLAGVFALGLVVGQLIK